MEALDALDRHDRSHSSSATISLILSWIWSVIHSSPVSALSIGIVSMIPKRAVSPSSTNSRISKRSRANER